MKLILITLFGLLLFNLLSANQDLKAQEKPLWEAGVGLVYAIAPDYPGANIIALTILFLFPHFFIEER